MLVLGALLLAASLFPLARSSFAGARRRPNVILISLDTLRADRMGCYGYAKPTTCFGAEPNAGCT